MEVGGWVQVSLGFFFFWGKSSKHNPKPVLIFLSSIQCFMQRPVQPSYGRVKQNVDGCLFAWTGVDVFFVFFNSYLSWSPERRTAQSALHVMLLSY